MQARCDELQGQVIRFLKVEQDLVNTRNQLDRDLDRFRAIQEYSRRIIRAGSMEEFAEITVESLIETFELECSALFLLDETDRCCRIGGLFGLNESHADCRLDEAWITKRELQKEGKVLIEHVAANADPFSTMGLAQVILSSFHKDNHELEGILMGGISKEKKDYYDEIREFPNNAEMLTENIASVMKRAQLPFLGSDRNVLNLPGVGKSLTFRTIGITRYGRRILEFELDHTRNHSPVLEQMDKVIIIESKSISEYLRQLEDIGEETSDYDSIWGYSIGETEPRIPLYEYPEYGFEITEDFSNLELIGV